MSKWLAATALVLWCFGAGLLVGREMPAHHFERFGNSGDYLLDSTSGRICHAWPATTGNQNLADSILDQNEKPKDDSGLGQIWKTPSSAADRIQPCVPQ